MGIRFRCQACEKKLNVKSFLGGKRGICPHCGAKIAIPPAEGAPPVSATAGPESAAAGSSIQAVMADSQPTAATSLVRETAGTKGPSSANGGHISTSAEAYPPTVEEGPSVSLAAPVAKLPNPPAAAPQDALSEAPDGVWYVRPPSGGQYGPASAEYMHRWIEEGRVSGDSLVWRDGWTDWQPASTVLAGLLPGQATGEIIPAAGPTLDPAGQEVAAEDSSIAKRGKRRSRRSRKNFSLAMVVVLCLLIVVLLFALIKVLMS